MKKTKILLIQLRQIGDVLLSTPAIRAIKLNMPDSFISFLVEPYSRCVLENNPYIDEIIEISRVSSLKQMVKIIKSIRFKNFDIVVDFLGNPRSSQIAALSGARKRVGFAFHIRKYAYNIRVPQPSESLAYSVDDKLRLLDALKIKNHGRKLDFFLNDNEKEWGRNFLKKSGLRYGEQFVTISPVSRKRYRMWSLKRFSILGDLIQQKLGRKVILTWGPGEKEVINEVVNEMDNLPIHDYKTMTFRELASIIHFAALHVGNNNGPMHLAISLDVPTIGIFHGSEASCWSPPENPKFQIIEKSPGCPTCLKEKCRELVCLKMIYPAEVALKIKKMLSNNTVKY